MTAKIDTQAPDIVRTLEAEYVCGLKVAAYVEDVETPFGPIERFCTHWSTTGKGALNVRRLFTEEQVRALLAERDLSVAREAAAAQAMREAARHLVAKFGTLIDYQRRDVTEDIQEALDAIPLPDPTALDRLIAERVREAFAALDECLEWMEQLRASGDAGFWEWQPGDAYNKGMALIARGRKEGQS